MVIVRYAALPRWIGWIGFPVAVTLFIPWIGRFVAEAWILVVSIVLLIHAVLRLASPGMPRHNATFRRSNPGGGPSLILWFEMPSRLVEVGMLRGRSAIAGRPYPWCIKKYSRLSARAIQLASMMLLEEPTVCHWLLPSVDSMSTLTTALVS